MGGFQFIRFQAPFREPVLYISQRSLEFVRRYYRVSMGGEQDTRRIRTNREIWELYYELDTVTGIGKGKNGMDWIGLQVRKDHW